MDNRQKGASSVCRQESTAGTPSLQRAALAHSTRTLDAFVFNAMFVLDRS
jgi:hypothetical protein